MLSATDLISNNEQFSIFDCLNFSFITALIELVFGSRMLDFSVNYETTIAAASSPISYSPIWYATLAKLAAMFEIGKGLNVGISIEVVPIYII